MQTAAPRNASLLFLPRRYQRGIILRWLKRTHAWLAMWGGIAGLIFGLTGVLLNHRDVLKIPAIESHASTVQIPLEGAPPETAEAMASLLINKLGLANTASPRITRTAAKPVAWGDSKIQQPERWEVSFSSPSRFISAEYWVGNNSISVQNREGNVFYWLTRLHKANGVHVGWILAADALAGALLLMTITGFLLWSRLHGPRLLALGLASGSLALLGVFAALS